MDFFAIELAKLDDHSQEQIPLMLKFWSARTSSTRVSRTSTRRASESGACLARLVMKEGVDD